VGEAKQINRFEVKPEAVEERQKTRPGKSPAMKLLLGIDVS